ncbi:MAG: hypothetical protein Q8P95_05030 [bacterium]|nr:hypothetical protein [bacterium]
MAIIQLRRQTQKPSVTHERKSRESGFKQLFFQAYFVVAVLVILVSFTSFFYLSEFNQVASQGVIINSLERERAKLIIENEVWNMRIARLKSLDVIEMQDVVQRLPIIDPAEIEFVDLAAGS